MNNLKFLRLFILCLFLVLLFLGTGIAATDTDQTTPTDSSSSEQPAVPPSEETPTQDLASMGAGAESFSSSTSGSSSILFSPILQPNPNTGAAVTSIQIEVPPGRKGVQPNLALTYNSNLKNGWLGEGWDIPLSSIQRNTKYGVNYSSNDFISDGAELVARGDWGSNYYGAKIEGKFAKYYFNTATGGWEVTGKDGTKYYYGTTSASRQDNAYGTFKWMPDKVQDINGNYMTFSYWKDQGEVYIDRIDYTGNAGLSTTNYVKFYREIRTDAPPMYTTNSQVITGYRIKTIEVYGNGQLASKYILNYGQSTSTYRSLLTVATRYGSDGVTTLPTTTFGYQASSIKSYSSHPNGYYGPGSFTNYKFYPADHNGDGKTDIVAHEPTLGYIVTMISNGNGTYTYNGSGDYGPGSYVGYNFYPADVNGDGKTDIVAHNPTQGYFIALISHGDRTYSSHPNGLYGPGAFTNYRLYPADHNGDGKMDIVAHDPALGYVITMISNGDGTFTYNGSGDYGPGTFVGYNFYPADHNGDGKTDIVAHEPTAGYVITMISNGNRTYTYNGSGDYGPGTFIGFKFYPADHNGDGKTDIVAHEPTAGYVITMISKGNRTYIYNGSGDYGPGTFVGYNFYPADHNGDGKTDIVAHEPTAGYLITMISKGNRTYNYNGSGDYGPGSFVGYKFYPLDATGNGRADLAAHDPVNGYAVTLIPVGAFPDVLTSITNGIGSTTNIVYSPSSAYSNTLLPFIVQTASSVSINDGNGNISTTNYTYSGGLYNYLKREFRGFQYSKSTDPVGSTAETWFKQDDIFKGLPYDRVTKDSSGNIYTRVYNTYQSTSPYTGVNFPYISQRDDYIYDGTASSKRAAITFTYDSYGNITRKYMYGDVAASGDEMDEYTEYSYDTTKWMLNRPSHTYVLDSSAVKRAEGWFTYDANGNLLTETKWLNGGINPEVTYGYDAYGNQTSVTDPKGYSTTVTYDNSTYTYPVQTTNHLGHTITAAYDQRFGKVTSQTDPNGNATTYEYDVFGRPTKVINPNDGASTYGTVSYYYLNFGTVGSQKVVRYSTEQSGTANYIWDETYFDGLGRTIKARREGPDSKTIVQTITYNQRGLKSAQTLPYFEGLETPRNITITYDPAGRVTRATNPDNTFVTTSYDKGRITTVDPNDHKKVHEKDVYGRLVKVEEYSGTTGSYALYATTTYQYDARGNLTRTTDTLGNQTNISYDTLGRKTSMTDPDMGTWSYAYDANGNLTSQTDAKGQTIAFTYDALNRVTLKDYPTGTDVTYAYDEIAWSTNAKGRLTSQTDATGTIKFYYDKLGAITKSTRTIDSVNYAIETTYDALGRTTSLKYPDGEILNYTYDTAGNLSQAGTFATYSNYNALGQAGTVSYGNGVNTTYQYLSTNNRLSSIITSKQSQNLLSISYSYDNGGNILGINDLLDLNRSQGFTYDHLNRLTQAQSTSYGTLSYSYNQIGNMLSKEGVSYTYGGARPHAVTATSDGKTYTYDANGNMTADTQRTISYDYDNMPSSVTLSGVTTNFVYDWSGARVKKTTSGITTLYISKIYECTNGSCGKYVFAGDNRVALKRGTEVLYYHQDHLNSSSIITDATGIKVEEIYYYPFGGTRTDTGSISVNHKYTSQELDGETGLYYYGARYYNPQLGRFISPDSIVTDAANPQDFNRYSYVLNNPLIYIDPSGHSWLSEAFHDAEDWVSEHTEEATGLLLQAVGGVFFVPGTYMLSQSEEGRAILLTELAIGAAIMGVAGYFGPVGVGEPYWVADASMKFVAAPVASNGGWEIYVGFGGAGGGLAWAWGGGDGDGDGSDNSGGSGSSGGSGGGTPSSDIGFISSAPSFPRSAMDTVYTDYHRLVHPDYFGENARTEVVMEYLGKALEVGLTVAMNLSGYRTGYEFSFGKNFRIAPWGNRTGHPFGELPHYHRRIPDPSRPGHGLPGQGIGNHRPWEGGW